MKLHMFTNIQMPHCCKGNQPWIWHQSQSAHGSHITMRGLRAGNPKGLEKIYFQLTQSSTSHTQTANEFGFGVIPKIQTKHQENCSSRICPKNRGRVFWIYYCYNSLKSPFHPRQPSSIPKHPNLKDSDHIGLPRVPVANMEDSWMITLLGN